MMRSYYAFFDWLVAQPRWVKRLLSQLVDLVLLGLCFCVAMALRLDSLEFFSQRRGAAAIMLVAPLTIAMLAFGGVYRVVLRYMSLSVLRVLAIVSLISAISMFVLSNTFALWVPRSVPPIYGMLMFLALGGMRLGIRFLLTQDQMQGRTPVIIYGAGSSGRQVLHALLKGQEYVPVAFIDDAVALHGADIEGKRVYPRERLENLIQDLGVRLVLLAIPATSRVRRKEILDDLSTLAVQIRTIPGMADLVSGRAQISDIREVPLDDLLGRDPVAPDSDLMGANITGKVVMVTGAGGSIGSELCRQIVNQNPTQLILFDVSEAALYALDIELRMGRHRGVSKAPQIIPIIGSVQNPRRIAAVLKRYKVDTVYHAAAYKHVPLVEQNMVEGLRNNVFGTQSLLETAIEAKVSTFILISTDKAVRPTNVMGASKRMAELVCQAHAEEQSGTRIAMVRFGNVLGSSGSVIPLFRAQIEAGGPLTVTHPEITRYFMSIPEAAQLVIQAGAMAQGGDVFVLDMGEPVRIVDLAARMARLSGLTPVFPEGTGRILSGDQTELSSDFQRSINVVFTGLRPGEKLYEELLIGRDAHRTSHPRIMTASESFLELEALNAVLDEMISACSAQDVASIRRLLCKAPTGYQPDTQVVDFLAQHDNELLLRRAGHHI